MKKKDSKDSFVVKAGKAYRDYKEKEELWRYAEVVITLVTISFFIIFAIRPTVRAISGLLSEINNKEELSRKMRSKVNNVVEAQTNFAEIQEKIFLLDDSFPENYQLAQGASDLVGLALEDQLAVRGFSFSPVFFPPVDLEKGDTVSGISFNMSLRGSYQQAKAFVGRVKQLKRLVKVDRYSLSIPKKQKESGLLDVFLSGKLFYFDQPEK